MLPDREATEEIFRKVRLHHFIRRKLGPLPRLSLCAMIDYGLDDQELGHYFHVTASSVRRLRTVLALQ